MMTKVKLILVVIIVLAFALRFYKVTTNPPSLNWDEVSIGYNAYSILKTGHDEWGKLLPIHFRAYGEYKLPAQIYASIPAIAIFGLNELGVRITPVIYGTITVFVLYFLTFELFKSKKVALLSAFLLATSPWHIQLTRASFESSFSVLWVILGIYFMVKGWKNPKWLVLSVLTWIIAIYTYNSARVFTPLFIFVNLLIYRRDFLKQKKTVVVSLVIFILCLLPLVPFSLNGDVVARYNLVSITSDPGLVPKIDEARNLSTLPPVLTRIVHNRITYLTFYFVRNYLAHFSPDFLFINGAGHKQHHVQGIGELYAVQAPFVILGIYYFLTRKEKHRWIVITWLFLAFIPVAVTRDSIPHALRTIIASPAYEIITAYGLFQFLESRKKTSRFVILAVSAFLFSVQFGGYLNNYFNSYPTSYSYDWQYGYSQVVSYIKDHYSEYDEIVFSRTYGEPHMFTLFFLGWDPKSYYNDPKLVRYQSHDWVWVTHFDKFYFPDLGDRGTTYDDIVKSEKGKKLLFVGAMGDFPSKLTRLKEVNFLNGNKAFEIVETK